MFRRVTLHRSGGAFDQQHASIDGGAGAHLTALASSRLKVDMRRLVLLSVTGVIGAIGAARPALAQEGGGAPVAAHPAADAAGGSAEGVVVAVEKDDLVLDVGGGRGAAGGDVVELWRPLRLKHPVTGKPLTDRFLIGRLRLVQVRPLLSLAVPEGALSRPAETGDVVVFSTKAPAATAPLAVSASAPATSSPTAATPVPAEDEESAELSRLVESLHGAAVAARIGAYQRFSTAHPNGRYSRALFEEALLLRKLLTAGDAPAAGQPAGQGKPSFTAAMQRMPRVVAREPLRLAAIVRGEVSGVVLHVREAGSPTYLSLPMARVGSEYWAATVRGEDVTPPAFDYFVEAIGPDGTVAVIGTAEAPNEAEVEDVLPGPPSKVLGQAQIWSEYASFNAKAMNDYIFQTEGFMGVRFGDVGVRAVRTGFGVYRGEGGTVYALDTLHQAPTSVGLTYGYLETELGLARYVSLGVRGVVGLDNAGVNGGGFLFLRIGSDLGTNLWFGAEGLGGIGVRGISQFEWSSFVRWPIVLRTEVTDEPAGGDVGVRAIAQVGYRLLPHLVVSVRGSYQGRTIQHSGPGAGAAVGYAW